MIMLQVQAPLMETRDFDFSEDDMKVGPWIPYRWVLGRMGWWHDSEFIRKFTYAVKRGFSENGFESIC